MLTCLRSLEKISRIIKKKKIKQNLVYLDFFFSVPLEDVILLGC